MNEYTNLLNEMLNKAKENKEIVTPQLYSNLFYLCKCKKILDEKDKDDVLLMIQNNVEFFIDNIKDGKLTEYVVPEKYIRIIKELYKLSLGGNVEIRSKLCSVLSGRYIAIMCYELDEADRELNEIFIYK